MLPTPPKRLGKRAAADKPSKRARTAPAAERTSDSTDGDSVATSSTASSSSSLSSFTSPAPCTARPSHWPALPLELLVLVADCEPSYRLLLPLSSTCRRFYELVHEESVAGVVQIKSAVQDAPARLSCWRQHAMVRVSVLRDSLIVDGLDIDLIGRDASLVSYVLTSLRNLPHLELLYSCAGGPHAANLYPLHRFTHLRSLILLLGSELAARTPNLASNLSAALLALPSLVDLSVISPRLVHFALDTATLQRLMRERLLHVTLFNFHDELWATPDQLLGRRRRGNSGPPTYPTVLSVAFTPAREWPKFALRGVRSTFPNIKHVALGSSDDLLGNILIKDDDLDALLDLDSLHARIDQLRVSATANPVVASRLRCLSLHCVHATLEYDRINLSVVLSHLPHLEQLAITGRLYCSTNEMLGLGREPEPSIFDGRNPLPKLTYLQFTGGLTVSDIDYLLSSTSPPAFAATLTHLELRVRWADRGRAAALLPSLPGLYPSLQRCEVSLHATPLQLQESAEEMAAWQAMWDGVALQLGVAVSAQAVRQDRLDVVWRRAAGMAPVKDEWPVHLDASLIAAGVA